MQNSVLLPCLFEQQFKYSKYVRCSHDVFQCPGVYCLNASFWHLLSLYVHKWKSVELNISLRYSTIVGHFCINNKYIFLLHSSKISGDFIDEVLSVKEHNTFRTLTSLLQTLLYLTSQETAQLLLGRHTKSTQD